MSNEGAPADAGKAPPQPQVLRDARAQVCGCVIGKTPDGAEVTNYCLGHVFVEAGVALKRAADMLALAGASMATATSQRNQAALDAAAAKRGASLRDAIEGRR